MKIRKANLKDIDSVYKLGLQEFKGELWFTREFLKETISTPGYYYVAFEDEKLVGAMFVRKFDRPKLWIFFFAVDKNYRRKGLGSRLLRNVEKKSSNDYLLLVADLDETQFEAKKFYSKRGFKEQARIKDWFGIGKKGIILLKELFCKREKF